MMVNLKLGGKLLDIVKKYGILKFPRGREWVHWEQMGQGNIK